MHFNEVPAAFDKLLNAEKIRREKFLATHGAREKPLTGMLGAFCPRRRTAP
jgi:hypothetical protein